MLMGVMHTNAATASEQSSAQIKLAIDAQQQAPHTTQIFLTQFKIPDTTKLL